MSITDVMSRVTALQNLIGQSAAPAQAAAAPTQAPGSATFGDALSASSSASSSGSSSSTSQNALLSLLEQSTAGQSLTSALGSDSSDSSGFSLPALPSLSNTLASVLSPATSAATTAPTSAATGTPAILSAAESQVGVTEQPPGSNDGPQISVYRDAVAGAAPDQPWCASFVSWAAAQAGEPVGSSGQGLDSVQGITDWASSTGRLLPATSTPSPGDLILFGDRHVGIVEAVNTNGSLTTVEGNYGNAVQYVQRSPSEATGYVKM